MSITAKNWTWKSLKNYLTTILNLGTKVACSKDLFYTTHYAVRNENKGFNEIYLPIPTYTNLYQPYQPYQPNNEIYQPFQNSSYINTNPIPTHTNL